jgi:hypothetical protein
MVADQVHAGELRIGLKEVLRKSGRGQNSALVFPTSFEVSRLFMNAPTLPLARKAWNVELERTIVRSAHGSSVHRSLAGDREPSEHAVEQRSLSACTGHNEGVQKPLAKISP